MQLKENNVRNNIQFMIDLECHMHLANHNHKHSYKVILYKQCLMNASDFFIVL